MIEPRVAVGLVVRDGRVLMTRRKKRESTLRWNLPGGSIEPGETAEEAVVREVLEETGVVCTAVRRLGIRNHPDTHVTICYVLCHYVDGSPRVRERDRSDRAQWVEPSLVERYVTTSLARAVRKELRDMRSRASHDGIA